MPDRENFPTNKNVVAPPKPPIWPFRSKFVSLSMRRYTNGRPSVHRNTGRTAAPPHETMKNSKPIAITLMSILSLFGCGPSKAPEYPSDQLTARDGTRFTITFFKHASLSISAGGKYIYVDPSAPTPTTPRCRRPTSCSSPTRTTTTSTWRRSRNCSRPTRKSLRPHVGRGFRNELLHDAPGQRRPPRDWVKVEAVAAYNTTPGHLQFHPQGARGLRLHPHRRRHAHLHRGRHGADTEMRALRDIDIAFLPVNQPYTMTVEQAAEAVKALRPAIFYPYHYGEVEEKPTSTGWCARPRG